MPRFPLALFLSAFSLAAQVPGETIQERTPHPEFRSALPGLPLSEITVRDIGEIEPVTLAEPPPVLTLATRHGFFYTDNALFTKDDPIGSTFWEGTFSGRWVPYSTAHWTPWMGAEHVMVRYDRVSEFDYNGQMIAAGSDLVLSRRLGLTWGISYGLRRFYYDRGSESEFYKYGSLQNELIWMKPLGTRVPATFMAAYSVEWRHATPSHLDRVENMIRAGVAIQPHPAVLFYPHVAGSVRSYPNEAIPGTDPHDLNVRAGLVASWMPLRQLALRASILWWRNDSDASWREYETTLIGLSLSGRLSF
jgi:hypothetical protein